ncbi:hypothetical protein HZB60_00085 [candidate division KSB1 bacterium]|nr:hypothetical protein [candidate division KSB1 bacterium]
MSPIGIDDSLLSAVSVDSLQLYLASRHWRERESIVGKASLWTRDDGDEEVLVPQNNQLRDFVRRISDLLQILEYDEARPSYLILKDSVLAWFDCWRIRRDEEDTKNGTISFEDGARLIAGMRDLLSESTRGFVQSLQLDPEPSRPKLRSILRRFRLGQTEMGSFVATLVTNVKQDSPSDPISGLQVPGTPVQRLVLYRLNKTIFAAVRAAETSRVEQFRDSILDGVTPRVCRTLAAIGAEHDLSSSVEISFQYSMGHVVTTPLEARVAISPEAREMLSEAAEYLTHSVLPATDEKFAVRGPVVVLQRDPNASEGTVYVFSDVEGRNRRIRVELKASAYRQAIHAHEQNLEVSCRGTLVREGRAYRIDDPKSLTIMDSGDQIDLELPS